jgi:hypothetical protein
MAFHTKYTTSVHGRRLGLQAMTTPETGGSFGKVDFIVGAEAVREGVVTESTGTAVKAYGVSLLPGTSAASSSVYIIDPPIPGVRKLVIFSSGTTPQYLKTKNAETFRTTADSTIATVLLSTLTGCAVELVGLTTAMWGLLTNGTSTISRAATT